MKGWQAVEEAIHVLKEQGLGPCNVKVFKRGGEETAIIQKLLSVFVDVAVGLAGWTGASMFCLCQRLPVAFVTEAATDGLERRVKGEEIDRCGIESMLVVVKGGVTSHAEVCGSLAESRNATAAKFSKVVWFVHSLGSSPIGRIWEGDAPFMRNSTYVCRVMKACKEEVANR